MFITFEGGEGCGKSTHSKRLKTYLEGKGYKVLLTQEPGGTQIGKEIRSLLLQPKVTLEALTEVYLFAADRSEHVKKIILPALTSKKNVISDRFIDSTVAYQVGGRGLPQDLIEFINMTSSQGATPNLTFLLDVTPEIGIKRATQDAKADRFEKENLDFHRRVREKYLQIAKESPKRVEVINTDEKGIDEIQDKIRKIVEKKLAPKTQKL